tara:strand:+ start:321 stop:905 length:585 start_codon:yes stop_codon:yes gene_type:complete
MINADTTDDLSTNYSFRNAEKKDIDDMIDVIGDYYSFLKKHKPLVDRNKEPWTWISDYALTFRVLLIKKKICGFFISRHIHKNTHLHSLFVKNNYRNKGLGGVLLKEHWREAIKKNKNLNTFTLHMHSENKSAVGFYLNYGYKKIIQSPLLLKETDGFGSWALNCKKKDQWPLREGIELYGLVANEDKKIVSIQ